MRKFLIWGLVRVSSCCPKPVDKPGGLGQIPSRDYRFVYQLTIIQTTCQREAKEQGGAHEVVLGLNPAGGDVLRPRSHPRRAYREDSTNRHAHQYISPLLCCVEIVELHSHGGLRELAAASGCLGNCINYVGLRRDMIKSSDARWRQFPPDPPHTARERTWGGLIYVRKERRSTRRLEGSMVCSEFYPAKRDAKHRKPIESRANVAHTLLKATDRYTWKNCPQELDISARPAY